MHFSAQHSAALVVAVLSTHAVASGVKAAPIHHNGAIARSNIPDAAVDTFNTVNGMTSHHDKREPEPARRKGSKGNKNKTPNPAPKTNQQKPNPGPQRESLREKVASHKPSLGGIADGVSATSGIASDLGNMYTTFQDATAGNVKREPEPEPIKLPFGKLAHIGEEAVHGLGSLFHHHSEQQEEQPQA